MNEKLIENSLLSFILGDVYGLPFEFKSRKDMKFLSSEYILNIPNDHIRRGFHKQLPGTWSDDTSLMLVTIHSLNKKPFNIYLYYQDMLSWLYGDNFNCNKEEPFDIGYSTQKRLRQFKTTDFCWFNYKILEFPDEDYNGNGALMRILPLAFIFKKEDAIEDIYKAIKYYGAITHNHHYSYISCLIYILFAKKLFEGIEKFQAYKEVKEEVSNFIFNKFEIYYSKRILNKKFLDRNSQVKTFMRILKDNIYEYSESEIYSTGFVLDTLEAVFWSILNFNSWEECIVNSIKLGDDTDTIGALTGGLAGLIYEKHDILQLMDKVRNKEIIFETIKKFIYNKPFLLPVKGYFELYSLLEDF